MPLVRQMVGLGPSWQLTCLAALCVPQVFGDVMRSPVGLLLSLLLPVSFSFLLSCYSHALYSGACLGFPAGREFSYFSTLKALLMLYSYRQVKQRQPVGTEYLLITPYGHEHSMSCISTCFPSNDLTMEDKIPLSSLFHRWGNKGSKTGSEVVGACVCLELNSMSLDSTTRQSWFCLVFKGSRLKMICF